MSWRNSSVTNLLAIGTILKVNFSNFCFLINTNSNKNSLQVYNTFI